MNEKVSNGVAFHTMASSDGVCLYLSALVVVICGKEPAQNMCSLIQFS